MAKSKNAAETKMEKKAKKKAKKWFRNLHTATKLLMLLSLVVGILGGAFVCNRISKNDRFILKGESSYSIDLVAEEGAAPYLYREEGVEAVCFGRDVSGKLTVETTLEQDADGNYIIPVDKEGIYTITYTVDCLKFGEKAPNGVIKRVRTFVVTTTEEDGRHE